MDFEDFQPKGLKSKLNFYGYIFFIFDIKQPRMSVKLLGGFLENRIFQSWMINNHLKTELVRISKIVQMVFK